MNMIYELHINHKKAQFNLASILSTIIKSGSSDYEA